MTEGGQQRSRQEDRFRKGFALLLVALFSVMFARLIAPFIEALLLAVVLSGLMFPLYSRLERRLSSRVLAAGAMTLLVLLAIVLPLIFVVGAFTQQAVQLSENIVPWFEQQMERARIAFQLPGWLPFSQETDLRQSLERLTEVLNRSGSFFVGGIGTLTQATFVFIVQLFVMLYTIFHLLLAGRRLMNVFDYTPLTETDRELIVERGISITRATLKGTVVIGVLQGGLAGAAFALVGIPGPIFWGVIVTILSAVPGIGAAIVWVPAVAVLLFRGDYAAAIGLGVWCTLVVSTVDNIVRPYLVGNDSQMSAVLVLLGTLGGIVMFGAPGIIIGPLLAGFFVTSWHIFAAAFRRELDESEGETPLAGDDTSVEHVPGAPGRADPRRTAP